MINLTVFCHIDHFSGFTFRSISNSCPMFHTCPCVNFYSCTGPHCRQGKDTPNWLKGIYVRQYQFTGTVFTHGISIHSYFFCLLAQGDQMLGLYLVNVHKRDHDSYCCQKQWQYQRTFHSQTCFFQPSERTAQGHFFRTTDFAFRGKQTCPVFPKAFPFCFVISRLYLFNFFHAAAFARLLPQFCAMHRMFLKKHPCASFLITIFPCNGKHLSGIGLHIRRCFQCGYAKRKDSQPALVLITSSTISIPRIFLFSRFIDNSKICR